MGCKKYNSRKKCLKWRFSSCWFSLICTLPCIFHFYSKNMNKFYARKRLNLQYGFDTCIHIEFFRFFKLVDGLLNVSEFFLSTSR